MIKILLSYPMKTACRKPLVAEKIQFLHKHEGLAYKDIAVFYKKHATAERIAQYFQHVGIPIQIVRTTNILEEALTQQIRSILIYLQNEMQSPFKGAHLLHQILHFPCFGLSGTAISRVHVSVQKLSHKKLSAEKKSMRIAITDFSGETIVSSF